MVSGRKGGERLALSVSLTGMLLLGMLAVMIVPFTPLRQLLLLRFSPSEMTKISLKGLFGALEIRPSIDTVALGKIGFVGVQ